jgi:hypothetical protein
VHGQGKKGECRGLGREQPKEIEGRMISAETMEGWLPAEGRALPVASRPQYSSFEEPTAAGYET